MGILILNLPCFTSGASAFLVWGEHEGGGVGQAGLAQQTDEETEEEVEEETGEAGEETEGVGEETEDISPETLEDEARQIDRFDPLDEMNALVDRDFWRSLRGSLPCLEYEANCVVTLQNLAVGKSPLLSSIDQKLEAIAEAIDEAAVMNSEDKKIAVLKPALVYLATPESVTILENNQQTQERRGLLSRIAQIVTAPTQLIDNLIGAIASPLADYLTGGSAEYKRSEIAIAGLQAESANLRIDRQKLELDVRKIIDERLAAVDVAAREYRLSLSEIAIARRQGDLYKLSFSKGLGDLDRMMAIESSVDAKAGEVISRFTALRTEVNRLKFLAYGGSPIEE